MSGYLNDLDIEQLLDVITKCGCNCKLSHNIFCSIHVYINRLRHILQDREVI